MSEATTWLEAGGLVPVDATLTGDVPSDTVDARGYTHPALADRVLVRLVPDAIARGVDTEMTLLGFSLGSHADDIARQRRRALGFPGAALVIDPDRAKYALEVMREFKKHAKRVASKPGHAKEGFDEIADRLSRQVPHFLPSYWEEVARAFATGGNPTYAASSFDRARTAEREFGLQVDEERRGEAFLEFALLGALTVKSLQSYGKELQKSVGPKAAYERMSSLAVRRTLGGVAPWASLPKDLRTLAKAAKLDQDTEDQRLLTELVGAPAIQRAPGSFWIEYRDAWVALCRREPRLRAKLMDLFPNGGKTRYSWRDTDDGFSDDWMVLLADAGAFEVLWDDGAPAEALPAGGRAAWFGRLQGWARHGNGWILQLLRKSAARLRADGVPIVVDSGNWHKPLDLDYLDLLIELEVPWTLDGLRVIVKLDRWAASQACPERCGLPAEHRPRDPVRAVRDERVVPHLKAAVDGVFGDAGFEAAAAGMKGLADLRRQWLTDRLADLDRTGLATTLQTLTRLKGATSADHFAEFPETLPALASASIARALATTLRLGVFEEFTWPAWDEALEQLQLETLQNVYLHRQFPHLILADARKAMVLGRDGVELTHDLKHAPGQNQLPQVAAFVGGSLYVHWNVWRSGQSVQLSYWSHAPNDTFECANPWWQTFHAPIEHADAIVTSARFTRGDRNPLPPVTLCASDATGAWGIQDGKFFARDRNTGAMLHEDRPAFLAGVHPSPSDWAYHPVPGVENSPLGLLDGQYGSRWRRPPVPNQPTPDWDDDHGEAVSALTLETLAGERWVGAIALGGTTPMPTALVRWPGAERSRPVAENANSWRNQHKTDFWVGDPDGSQVALAHVDHVRLSTHTLPPLAWWHFFVPTDLPGSQRLRRADEALGAALIAAGREGEAPLKAAIAQLLPEVTSPKLAAGIAHVAAAAAEADKELDQLRQDRQGGKVHRTEVQDVQDEALLPVLKILRRYWLYGSSPPVTAWARTLGRFLTQGETGETIVHSRFEGQDWVGRIRALCWFAGRSGLSAADRGVFARFVKVWAESGLAEDGPVRVGRLSIETADPSWMALTTGEDGAKKPGSSWRTDEGGRRMLVWGCEQDDPPWAAQFVERSPELGPWAGTTIATDREVVQRGDRAWLEAFAAMLPDHEPRAADPEAARRFAELAGISVTEAALVLEGLPEELDKDLREAYGLKHAEVKAVAPKLFGLGIDAKLDLMAAIVGDDPASVWKVDVEDLAAAWTKRFGRSVPVDAALVLLADKEMSRSGGQIVKWFANPSQWEALDTDPDWKLDDQGVPTVEGPRGFDRSTAGQVVEGAAWIVSRLPVGDPLRAEVPRVVARALERMASPKLWIHGLAAYLYEEKTKKAFEAWFDALPTAAEVVTRDDEGTPQFLRKAVGPVVVTKAGYRMNVAWHHAKLDPSARELIGTATRMADGANALDALDALTSDGFRAVVAQANTQALPAGAWEQDPSRSAPALVAKVAKAERLSEPAAVLWLQLLTLVDASKKNVIQWNGWTPAKYQAAVTELVERGLVLEGKRARAGREHFLPGGWVETKDILPYEEWKRPLYGWNPKTETFPCGNPVPLRPVAELFAAAWARCEGGDRPKFEEVRR